ncbi:hypothetical protein Cgig2_014451 [Carnegiea gigantea]|uniref:Uncharacterized protein n=1 Tax=Carnegiea gigantea TaxID=171969 RepID=A0A9Q1K2M5_9CARY|nr:hypothetical protein Cgig2_014451 [Carnegiea gigantea]
MVHVSDTSSDSNSWSDLSPSSHDSERTPPVSSQPEQDQTSTPPPHQVENWALDSIPGEWLSTSASQDRYNSFRTCSISVCEKLDIQFFRSEKFAFLEKLAKDNCQGLRKIGDIVYPRLVRLFYANLETKIGANGVYLVSLVKSVPITINHLVLEIVFGLKFTATAPPSLTRKMAKDPCLTHYACPPKLAAYKCQNKTPPYHVLFPELRLYMYRVANMTRPTSLSYGNLLTRIFTHFKVPFDSKDYITQLVPVICANSLKFLCFYKTATRGWKHASELISAEATALQVPFPEQPTLHVLQDSLESLREDYAEL